MSAITERITVQIGAELVEMITAACAEAPGVETGGLILLHGEGCTVTGPGPAALLQPRALEWDVSFIAGVLGVAGALGAKPFARWHKHTSPIILASEEDRASAEQLRLALGRDELVDVIVACGPDDRPIGWSAYVCTADEYRRVHLELPWEMRV